MSGKKLLILERSQANLVQHTTEDGAIILEGVFTEFGIRNKNNRIYEEKEVLPHINELKEKVNSGKLLGELDHPKDFDISLSNVSHVIESLNYDSAKKQVIGRIRLLNTTKGKEAQSLIKDGIPLHISSRAAGTVDEGGKVKIKKFFTYDLVADPGFENAELSRVNESYGFDSDDSLIIYEMKETENTKDKIKNTMEEKQDNFVTVEDFQKYTEYVKGVLNNVKESSNSDNSETVENLIKYTEHVAEKVNQVSDYSKYLSENLDKSISFSDYLAENVNQIKGYTSYLAEELDNTIHYSEHIAEKADQGIQYSESLAEKVDQGIQYSEHIAEKVDQGIQYSEHLAENIVAGIEYSEYVAEKVDQGIAYSEHIAEGLENSIKYTEYIAENVNNDSSTLPINESKNRIVRLKSTGKKLDFKTQRAAYDKLQSREVKIEIDGEMDANFYNDIDYVSALKESVNESKKASQLEVVYQGPIKKHQGELFKAKKENDGTYTIFLNAPGKKIVEVPPSDIRIVTESQVNESDANQSTKTYKESIDEKLERLISKAETKVVSEMHFMNFLSESKKNEFNSLSAEKQQLIVESMNAKPIMSTSQAENIWESSFIEKKRALNFIDDMPEKYQTKWASLSPNRQSQIIAESNFHSLNTPYAINNFWATRDLRPSQFELEKLNESKTAAEQTTTAKKEIVNESFASDLINRVKFNLGR